VNTAQIVESALSIIAAVAPGLLALLTSKDTDAEAIAHARAELDRLPRSDDADGWDDDAERIRRGD